MVIEAYKPTSFRIKLGVDKSAGDAAVPPKHATSKPNNLFGATIGVTTFTGPINNQLCVATQSVKVGGIGPRGFGGTRDLARSLLSVNPAQPTHSDDGAPPEGGHDSPHDGTHDCCTHGIPHDGTHDVAGE